MTQMQGETPTTHQFPSTPTSSLLVVDDNSMNRIMLSRYITKLGYQASLAENGRQALDKLQVLGEADELRKRARVDEEDGTQGNAANKLYGEA